MRKIFKYIIAALLFGWILSIVGFGQDSEAEFTRADTLRGMLRAERTCYDVTYYDLDLTINYQEKSISGSNTVSFLTKEDFTTLQIDLFEEMEIDHIEFEGNLLDFKREFNAVWVYFPRRVEKEEKGHFKVHFHGTPTVAKTPPWDGGFVWKEDQNGNPWVGVACEGIGASLWWPLKDHLSDEPEGMRINLNLPPGKLNNLMAVANGQLKSQTTGKDGTQSWEWMVSYPINSYNVTLNIADYSHIHDTYTNETGKHDLDYYVLSYNEDTAKKHFEQVKPMMKCFEKHFGEYPYWKDGYALVETSYWGMEHQGAVAYGNNYRNNAYNFDFIIVHETGHEWWGNNVSCSDHAELWIHESFCTYSEAVYLECLQGYDIMIQYMNQHRNRIGNRSPIVGPLHVNYQNWKDSDMYYKGAWILHTLRTLIDNDELWFSILKEMQSELAPEPIHTSDIVAFIQKKTGTDYEWFFREYLYSEKPPVFEYSIQKKGGKSKIKYRWIAENKDFRMQVGVENSGVTLKPTTEWQTSIIPIKAKKFRLDLDQYYVMVKAKQ